MKKQNTQHIGELLPELIKSLGIDRQIENYKIYNVWDLVVGDSVASYTVSKFFREGKLYCRLSSSVARSEVMIGRRDIIRKMNTLLGESIVKELIIQ